MVKKKSVLSRIFIFFKRLIILFFVSTILTTIIYIFFNPPLTPLMVIRSINNIISPEKTQLKKEWIPIESISDNLIKAVIAAEDNNFTEHWGFDFEAIKKANKLNKRGKKLRGASTISQQTAKNVFLWPDRTWVRKGFEVYFTGLVELCWSKKRILEVYLNVIEMGDGIYGAEEASQWYFKKSVKNLNRKEAALLAAILPNPRKWHPDKPSAFLIRKQQRILQLMDKIGRLDLK